MDWITTNIRIPEDVYMELKMEAAKRRKSVAALVREKIQKKGQEAKKPSTQRLLKDLEKFAKTMSKKYPNLRLSEKLIEMRYEQ